MATELQYENSMNHPTPAQQVALIPMERDVT
jgi:hypothetical protein